MIRKYTLIILSALVIYLAAIEHMRAQAIVQSLQKISYDVSDKQLIESEARQLSISLSNDQIIAGVFAIIVKSSNPVQIAAGNRLLLALQPFPFEPLVKRYSNAKSFDERIYILGLLSFSVNTETQKRNLIILCKNALNDIGPGPKPMGEARAYSSDGERVCDVAFNILIDQLKLTSFFQPIDVYSESNDEINDKIRRLKVYVLEHNSDNR